MVVKNKPQEGVVRKVKPVTRAPKPKPTLKSEVSKIKKRLNMDRPIATYVNKERDSGKVTWGDSQCQYAQVVCWNPPGIEAVIAVTPFTRLQDPTATGAADLTTALKNQKVPIKIFSELLMRNNYNIPMEMDIYLIEFKTNQSYPSSLLINELAADLAKDGLTNTSAGDALLLNPAVYPSDSVYWRLNIKVLEHTKLKFEVGDELRLTTSIDMVYNQEYLDEMGSFDVYDKYCRHWFIRTRGPVSHDPANPALVGFSGSGYDWVVHRRYDTFVDSDLKTHNIKVSGSYDDMSTAAITAPDTATEAIIS